MRAFLQSSINEVDQDLKGQFLQIRGRFLQPIFRTINPNGDFQERPTRFILRKSFRSGFLSKRDLLTFKAERSTGFGQFHDKRMG